MKKANPVNPVVLEGKPQSVQMAETLLQIDPSLRNMFSDNSDPGRFFDFMAEEFAGENGVMCIQTRSASGVVFYKPVSPHAFKRRAWKLWR